LVLNATGSLLLAVAVWGQQPAARPARLAVVLKTPGVRLGEPLPFRIELRDALNIAALAHKDFSVRVEALCESKGQWERTLVIRKGQNGVDGAAEVRTLGICLLKASHPELREDAAHFRVRPPARKSAAPVLWAALRPPDASGWFRFARFQPPGPAEDLFLDLCYSIEGAKPSANGSDPVRIEAILSDDAPQEVKIRLHASGGVLQPSELRIPPGGYHAAAVLTAQNPCKILVRCLSVTPSRVRLRSGHASEIEFLQALGPMLLAASPPELPLGESTEIQARFRGLNKESIRLDETRRVRFQLLRGLGDFAAPEVQAAAGAFDVVTRFVPRQTGMILISASAWPFPETEATPVTVIFPLWAFVTAAAGGFAGGLLNFYYRRKKGLKWALLAAAVSALGGALYFWFIHLRISPELPAIAISHPVPVFVITACLALGLIEAGAALKGLGAKPAR
jgi:hypothetical protein